MLLYSYSESGLEDGVKFLFKEPYTLEDLHILPKEPCILSKAPCILSKEPCILAKEPCILSEEPCILSEEPCILAKEPCILSKEPCILSNSVSMCGDVSEVIFPIWCRR